MTFVVMHLKLPQLSLLAFVIELKIAPGSLLQCESSTPIMTEIGSAIASISLSAESAQDESAHVAMHAGLRSV